MITPSVIIASVKRKCPACGKKFEVVVPWKLYCKPYCRLKAFRQRRKEADNGKTRRSRG